MVIISLLAYDNSSIIMKFWRTRNNRTLRRNKAISLLAIGIMTLTVSVSAIANKPDLSADKTDRHAFDFNIKQPDILAEKLYRKALFYYFQGESELALQQLAYNRVRLNKVDDNALLFEAGLQVSLGLYRQAEINLTTITDKLADSVSLPSEKTLATTNSNKRYGYDASKDLLAVALLQLAEQQVDQQQQHNAQKTLAKLQHLPTGYYHQYHMLSQLAYWPQPAKLHLTLPENSDDLENMSLADQQSNGYILLNQALMQIELGQVKTAEQSLITLKGIKWYAPEMSFWQRLFSSDPETTLPVVKQSKHEQQSLQDYASLLLAQLYVEQELFSEAYKELANFPQDSPFSEKAMFLFAYASLQTQHYQESSAIFGLMSERYPFSYLAWQADVLSARQYLIQRDLDGALTQYLAIETKYQQQLEDLQNFEQLVIHNKSDLATFLTAEPKLEQHVTSSWWHEALSHIRTSGQLGKVDELSLLAEKVNKQQDEVQWLDYAIELNEARQTKIIAQQQAEKYQTSITMFSHKRDQLAENIKQAEQTLNVRAFADQHQREWLARIHKGEQVLKAMREDAKYKSKAPKYQQRLKRIEGVLDWQLQLKFPQRLWQHKTQLQQLDLLLTQLKQQMTKVQNIQQLAESSIANTASANSAVSMTSNNESLNLATLKKRQVNIAQYNLELKAKVIDLAQLANRNLHTQVLEFIHEQRQGLHYYLHHTRRAMAKVLEALKNIDAKESVVSIEEQD